jgi:hypothetical protein
MVPEQSFMDDDFVLDSRYKYTAGRERSCIQQSAVCVK